MEKVQKENPSYYAIIPANVRYDNRLKANEKLLYGEITCLSQKTGKCFASNTYFSELYNVSKETISRWIRNLKENGFINTQVIYKKGTNQIINRYIQLIPVPIDEKINTLLTETSIPYGRKSQYPIDEKVKDNNTSNNNTRVNSIKGDKKTLTTDTKKRKTITLGEFKNVKLTKDEIDKLKEEYGVYRYKEFLQKLDEGIEMKGYKYKNHNLVIRNWMKRDGVKPKMKNKTIDINDML